MTTWLLLRGLTRDSHHWGAFPALLARSVDGAVHAIDLPGNGRLNSLPSFTRVERMADYCRMEAARRGLQPPFHLLALSLGAMIAVEWAARHPAELAALVLVNTSLRPHCRFHERLRPRAYLPLLGLMWPGTSYARWERTVLALTSRVRRDSKRLLADWVAWHAQHPVRRINALRQLLAAANYTAPHEPIAVPMLLLASERDGLVHSDCSKHLAAAWDRPLALHPEAGHDLPLDDAQWVIRQIRRHHQLLKLEGTASQVLEAHPSADEANARAKPRTGRRNGSGQG